MILLYQFLFLHFDIILIVTIEIKNYTDDLPGKCRFWYGLNARQQMAPCAENKRIKQVNYKLGIFINEVNENVCIVSNI